MTHGTIFGGNAGVNSADNAGLRNNGVGQNQQMGTVNGQGMSSDAIGSDVIPPMQVGGIGATGGITNGVAGVTVNGTENSNQTVAQPTIQQALATTMESAGTQIAQPTIQGAISTGSTGSSEVMAVKTGVNPWNGIP